MRLLLCCLAALTLLTCREGAAAAQTGETVVGAIDPRAPLRQGPDKGPDSKYLTLRMGNAEAGPGQKICLPVEASGFRDIVGFQYTIRFDSSALAFTEVREFNLPGYNKSNFGARFAERGYLSSLWTDNALKGTNLVDGHRLYELCFTNLMPAGEETEVRFTDGPTSFEVIDIKMNELRLVYANGRVTSR